MRSFRADKKSKVMISLIVLTIGLLLAGVVQVQGLENDDSEVQGRVDILVYEDGEYRDVGDYVKRYMAEEEGEEIGFSFNATNISYTEPENVTWYYKNGIEEGKYVNLTFEEGVHNVTLSVEDRETGKTYEDNIRVEIEKDERGTFLTAIGAGLAVGIAGMGAGIGVGIAGAAGAGTIAEKPDKFGKCLVFQALPQTQAIYGLLVAVLLLLFTGVIGGEDFVPLNVGIATLGVGLAVGIAGLSAIGQGIASSGSIAAYSEKEELFGKGMVFSVLPETQAIYGLLIGILIMVFTGLLGGDISADLLGEKGLGDRHIPSIRLYPV